MADQLNSLFSNQGHSLGQSTIGQGQLMNYGSMDQFNPGNQMQQQAPNSMVLGSVGLGQPQGVQGMGSNPANAMQNFGR